MTTINSKEDELKQIIYKVLLESHPETTLEKLLDDISNSVDSNRFSLNDIRIVLREIINKVNL